MSIVKRRPGARSSSGLVDTPQASTGSSGRRARAVWALALGLAVASLATSGLSRAAVPASFVDEHVADVPAPTSLAFTPDGRILVTTQPGLLRVIAANGTLVSTPAIAFGNTICSNNERGLLGVTVDPLFASNGHIYLYRTHNKSGRCVNRVSRYTLTPTNTVATSSELVLIDEIHSTAGNHNAGDLHIGKDGYLYVSVGDGGCDYLPPGECAGDNDAARDKNVLLGKVLRIARDGSIPPTNPWLGADSARCNLTGITDVGKRCQETFAWGLRNPFRLAFNPNAAGTVFHINDVGQGRWEEIDLGQAGADYGWNPREGFCPRGNPGPCTEPPPAGMTNPIFAYGRGDGCRSITGGAFVPTGVWPSPYDSAYLFGDYVCGKIFRLVPNGSGGYTSSDFASGLGSLVHMAFGPRGSTQALYYTTYSNGGQIRRIVFTGSANRVPTASLAGSPTSGAAPLAVAFDGSASSDPDPGSTLTYIWDFGDGSPVLETTTSSASRTYTAPGTYTANLRVRDQVGATSAPSSLRIDVGNTPPAPTIETPASGQLFRVGESISLRGSASDAQDGTLPASQLSWEVRQHHDTHWHPFLQPTPGNNIPITTPAPEDLAAATNSFLEIRLTATDSTGLASTVTRQFDPRKVDVTFATDPAGRRVTAGGATLTGPQTVVSWEAYGLHADAPAQVDGSGQAWQWLSWSDGGAKAHLIVTPATPATYTATFERAGSGGSPGLVAAYNFDEGSGTTAADLSGNANNASLSGATWTTAGKNAGAISFDGTNDSLSIADAPTLDLTTGMTLSAWVRPTGGSSYRTVLFKERPSGLAYALYAQTGGNGPSGHAWIGGAEPRARSTSQIAGSTWTHLAATYDGANVRLYVGGNVAVTAPATGPIGTSTGALRIGGNSVVSEWFGGQIDDVRVYDRALSEAEIETDMATPVAVPEPPAGSLISNGSFESSLAGWSTYRANAARVSGGATGGFAARVSFTGPGSGYAFSTSPRPVTDTTAGQVYEAGAMARSQTPGDRLCLVLREFSSTNAVVGLSTSCLTATGTWQAFPPLHRTATGSGGSLELYVEQGGAAAGDSFDLDAVSLTLLPPPEPEPGNLISNGGFESSLSGWSTYRADAARVPGGEAGASSARVTFSGPGSGYAFTTSPRPVTNTTAGQVYEAAASARSETPGDRLCLVLREWSSTNTVLGLSTSCLTATGAWQAFPPLQRTTTGNGGSLEVYVEQGGALPGDSFDLDAVSLTQPPPPEPGNLISNGGFESSTAGWSTYRANAGRVFGGAAGAFAARVTYAGPGSGYAFTTSPRPVTNTTLGQLYEAAASARSEAPGDRLCLVLREWSSTNTVLGLNFSCLTATGAWQAFPPLQRTATGSGGSLELYVEQGGASTGDSLDLDAVSLTTG